MDRRRGIGCAGTRWSVTQQRDPAQKQQPQDRGQAPGRQAFDGEAFDGKTFDGKTFDGKAFDGEAFDGRQGIERWFDAFVHNQAQSHGDAQACC
ncbi:MAG: hypothetical protein QOK41_274 [Sphingomonadales bacterium]|jgi:hypothetical protein|nr:hypothetical protein [Sphingomonadales bacterium]